MARAILQTLMGAAGAVGFAVLFRIEGRKLWVALGGALAWAVYLLCMWLGLGVFASLVCATAAASLLSEILARAVKAPAVILLVPMLVPLIPGGDLYYMMSYLVRGDMTAFAQAARLVITEAGAIALGIICVSSAVNILAGLRGHARGPRRLWPW